MERGAAHFFDGESAKRHAVHISLDRPRMALVIEGDSLPAPLTWALTDLRAERGEADLNRLTLMRRADTTDETPRDPARLVLLDPDQIAWVRRTRPQLFRRDVRKGTFRKIALWTGGAMGAVVVMLFVILPAMANTLAPLIPLDREIALGKSVTRQMTALLSRNSDADLACTNPQGLAALDKITSRLTDARDMAYDLDLSVLNHGMVNAFAAPGGQIVVLRGLIDKAETPEEVAGVLAHEIGHVEARDPTRAALRAAGSAGLLTVLLGDFTGGTLIAVIGDQLISASYTREAEGKADTFALDMLDAADVSVTGFADFFGRLATLQGDVNIPEYLSTHPETGGRMDDARAFAEAQSDTTPLLSDQEWAALKNVCTKGGDGEAGTD